MKSAVDFNVSKLIRDTVPDVFDMMIAAVVVPTNTTAPLPAERISGTVGIAGENVTGAVYLHLPHTLARQATQAMLGDATGQNSGDNEINDVVGELTNMIAGALKSALCDADRPCAVSTPSVIRGAFVVQAIPDLLVAQFFFLCLGQRMAVEVHLKFENTNPESL